MTVITFDGNIQLWLSSPCNLAALNAVLRGDAVIVPIKKWNRT
jgi:hypothetical protein